MPQLAQKALISFSVVRTTSEINRPHQTPMTRFLYTWKLNTRTANFLCLVGWAYHEHTGRNQTHLRRHPPVGASFSSHVSFLRWLPWDSKVCNLHNLFSDTTSQCLMNPYSQCLMNQDLTISQIQNNMLTLSEPISKLAVFKSLWIMLFWCK
jgi:hypothetical protein